MSQALSDGFVRATLRNYAFGADALLRDPDSWVDETPDKGIVRRVAGLPRRLLRRLVGASREEWDAKPVEQRVAWWLRRINAVVVPVAATPRVFGVAADRLPLQATFGAAAQGLAVCAVAREHGVTDPDDWVPLLAQVLMDRELAADAPEVPPADESAAPEVRQGLMRRGGRAVWGLARMLYGLYGAFNGRPRGPWIFRALGKVPVVGFIGGVFDERVGVRRAAEETTVLLQKQPA